MYQPSKELRSLQLKCQEILDVVHDICIKHNIKYSLCGGSVVGAHLYGGFIPWDDDVDLMLTRENYNKLISVCRDELPDKYRLVNYQTCKEYPSLFSKIIDETTTLVQEYEVGQPIVGGVFLDFTCYDQIPSGWVKKIDMFFYTASQWAFSAEKSESPSCLKDRLRNIWISIFGHYPSWLYKLSEKVFTTLARRDEYTYSELFGAYANTIAYPSHIFENYSTIKFEGKEYMIVRDYVEYLTTRYNRTDFYEPEEKQVPPHYVYVNLELSYKEYLKKI